MGFQTRPVSKSAPMGRGMTYHTLWDKNLICLLILKSQAIKILLVATFSCFNTSMLIELDAIRAVTKLFRNQRSLNSNIPINQ